MTPRVVVTDAVGEVAGRLLVEAIEAVATARDRCRLALPGGTAPVPVLGWLVDHLTPALLERLVITWVDERHLPLPSAIANELRAAGEGEGEGTGEGEGEGEGEGAGEGEGEGEGEGAGTGTGEGEGTGTGEGAGEGTGTGTGAGTAVRGGAGGHGFDWRALPRASNLRLAWEHWLSRSPVVPSLLPMARPEPLLEAARRFAEEFVARLGGLDVVLLGAGPDGHIASLFPGHPALRSTGACVAVPDSPKPPPQRLSLTLPVLQDVEHALLVAQGEAKADVLQRAYAGDESIPLGRYRPRGAWTWVLDPAAATALPSGCHEPGSPLEGT